MDYHGQFPDATDLTDVRPIKGLIYICELENGVSLSASDVASTENGTHSGQLPRSIAVIMHLGGADIDVRFCNDLRLRLTAGQAKMVCVETDTVMSHETVNGQSARTVLLHCRPEQIETPELLPSIDQLTAESMIHDVNIQSASWQ